MRWLPAGNPRAPGYDGSLGDYDVDNGHGSCITGLVSSPLYGVSKNANLVIVKTQEGAISDQVDAFIKIWNDIDTLESAGEIVRPVINFSRGIEWKLFLTPAEKRELKRLYNAIEEVIKKGAVVVAASGNCGKPVMIRMSRMH